MTQAIGLAILEFGVVLHSLLIGLTLAVDEGFIVLFIVLVFHRAFFIGLRSVPLQQPIFQKRLRDSVLVVDWPTSNSPRSTSNYPSSVPFCESALAFRRMIGHLSSRIDTV